MVIDSDGHLFYIMKKIKLFYNYTHISDLEKQVNAFASNPEITVLDIKIQNGSGTIIMVVYE